MDQHQTRTESRQQHKQPAPPTTPVHPPLPFTKCHTDGNDFIIVASSSLHEIPQNFEPKRHILARALCNRRTGIGGDGLILVSPGSRTGGSTSTDTTGTDHSVTVDLWNSDGSKAEISGNGTCCVAAFVVKRNLEGVVDENGRFVACTGAGRRGIQFIRQSRSGSSGNRFHFLVAMGMPVIKKACVDMRLQSSTEASVQATIMNVGNPQCALFYEDSLPQYWREMSMEIQADNSRFPEGVNISFSRVIDSHTLSTAFFERGAGETSSSGTGSIGAAIAAIVRGFAQSPVEIRTASGGLKVLWEGPGSIVELEGHAEVVAEGKYFGSLGLIHGA